MKKILITGAHSYIGASVADYLARWPEKYAVDTLSVRGEKWKQADFSGYDAVFHVAGIAHADVGHVSEERKAEYYAVNRDLTLAVAEKAKADGVGQFLYMSSAIVYGDSAPIGKRKAITKDTPVAPANFYGDSKVQAEKGLKKLESDAFRVAVLRPPMIYGPGSKGNYPTLSKMARKLPLFPKVDNQRSMLYVENLAECVRLLIEQGIGGIFWPQNREYSNTSQLVALIAKAHGKHIVLVPGFTWALKLLSHCTGLVNKAFGSLCYDPALSAAPGDYCVADLARSIEETEKTL